VRSAEKDRGSVLSGGCLWWLASSGLGSPSSHRAQTMTQDQCHVVHSGRQYGIPDIHPWGTDARPVVCALLCIQVPESPRYLVGKGRDVGAVEVIHEVAKFNRREERCTLTVGDLQKAVRIHQGIIRFSCSRSR
jgi:hypothetical protein